MVASDAFMGLKSGPDWSRRVPWESTMGRGGSGTETGWDEMGARRDRRDSRAAGTTTVTPKSKGKVG